MKPIGRVGFTLSALFASTAVAFAIHPRPSDETVTACLNMGDDGEAIANAFGAVWSQSGTYTCTVSGNALIVDDNTGDCDEPRTRYEFEPEGGQLNEDRVMDLRIECSSPVSASMQLDLLGFSILSVGPNIFVSGTDTITVDFSTPLNNPLEAVPAMPPWGMVLLAGLFLTAIAVFLRRERLAAPAN